MGKISIRPRLDSKDLLALDEYRFTQWMDDLSLDRRFIRAATRDYLSTALPLGHLLFSFAPDLDGLSQIDRYMSESLAERRSVITSVMSRIGFEEVQQDGPIRRHLRVPLFHLNSPTVKASRVTYTGGRTEESQTEWTVGIYGSGGGATQFLKYTETEEFSASDGERKRVFLPVDVNVWKITRLQRGQSPLTELKTEVPKWRKGPKYAPGVALVSPTQPPDEPDPGDYGVVYPLSDDVPDNISRYSREWTKGGAFTEQLGIEAYGTQAGIRASVSRERSLALTFSLPGGRNYRLRSIKGGDGLCWSE